MLYTDDVFRQTLINKKSRDFITLSCHVCGCSFNRRKNDLQWSAARGRLYVVCSTKCGTHTQKSCITVSCSYCGKGIVKQLSQKKKSKSGNSFCNHSCATTYQNAHKTTGSRRSKLEIWLEQQLILTYPALSIEFNKKDTINSELDIYIPSLNLAFELNGIFHYEPIYGKDKLESILNNDDRKFQACLEHGIELCIIDSSKQKRFTDKSSQQYLDIINDIITSKLALIA